MLDANDKEIKDLVEVFEINNERIFVQDLKPDFQLEVPENLTKEIYIRILKKIFACLRRQVYLDIRMQIRKRPLGSELYLTKTELRVILH